VEVTINLDDGLQFPELLEIMRRLRVDNLLSADLHKQLLDGTNSLLNITSALQNPGLSWLVNFLPGGIAAELDGGARALQLMKGLLEA
jgi:hypothetical protein